MSAQRRLSAISKHLESPAGEEPQLRARDLYLWLTRDNVELRGRMFDFLKVSTFAISYQIWLWSPQLRDPQALPARRIPCMSHSTICPWKISDL